MLYSRRVKVAYDENILVRNAAIYQCCLRDLVLFGGDSALRDKSGVSARALQLHTPSMRPCARLKSPDFSSQNKRSGASVSSQVSLEILESHSGFTKQVQPLESTFESPTATPRILEEEKRTENKKVDSSSNAYFLSLRALLRKAWQSIQKYTNPLESTFEKTAQKAQEIQTLQKADSSDTPIFATAKTMDCHATATQCLAMTENNATSENKVF